MRVKERPFDTQPRFTTVKTLGSRLRFKRRKRYRALATIIGLLASVSLPVNAIASPPQTATFDDIQPGPLNGQYPSGVIDWGSGGWVVSAPWGAFTTNSVSFLDGTRTSGTFTFLTPQRLISMDAYNGDVVSTTLTLTCGSASPQLQTTLAAGQVAAITTGWSGTCPSVTLASTNGWNTNFDNLIWDDGAGPLITAVQAGNLTYNSATITWTTSALADSQVDYGISTLYGNSSPLNQAPVTNHSVTLTSLSPNTLYHLHVKSRNATGLAVSGDFTFSTASTACVPPVTNPIWCENSKPGNPSSAWDLPTPDAGDPTIQGFATDISVNKGETVNFKVSTPASSYSIDIYRMGYYGGMGARKAATLQRTGIQNQPACLADSTVGLVDCGDWAVSATWPVPADAVSGIYFAKLTRSDTGGASHVFFIVRDDAGTADLLFKTSDTTWQAYNPYGGASLYADYRFNLPFRRAYKVSYNRPFTTRDNLDGLGRRSFVFYSEYPMVRWLEANGYNVSYFTSVDTDRRGTLIRNHKVFLSVGHDEYWSGGMRANVESARDAGINLGFFSANQIFWKTRWENSIDGSNTAYRTLVTYKETHVGAPLDPQDPPTWTGTWRDPRFSPPADGGRPENALSGSIFTVNGPRYDTMRVGSEYSQLRFWRNTAIANLSSGQSISLAPGTLGHEWDEDLDNGFRPAGLFRLSSTSIDVTPSYLQDYGSTYGSGTATHSLTIYKHASGALVFGAGTIQWSWGLDDQHDTDVPPPPSPDRNMQQATVNLFADMGVQQPSSLRPGLVAAAPSTDRSPPTSTITSPTQGAGIPNGQLVTITGTAADTGGGVVAGVEVSTDGGTTWHPATGRAAWSYLWTPNSYGAMNIRSRAVDDSGNVETPSAGVTVTVPLPPCPCTIWPSTATPAVASNSDTNSVEVGVRFRTDVDGSITGLRFYKGPSNPGPHVGSLWTNPGALLAQSTFTGETASGWQQLTFATPVVITANTIYVASYHAPNGGYSLTAGYFGSRGADNVPLHAPPTGAVVGGNGAYAYAANPIFPGNTFNGSNYWVDVVFSYSAAPPPTISNVQASAISATGATITWTTSVGADSQVDYGTSTAYSSSTPVNPTLTLNHSVGLSGLSPATGYNFRVRSKDSTGRVVTSGNFTFTTTSCPCTIWPSAATPGVASNADSNSVEIGVRFKSEVNGFITGLRFYKGPNNPGPHVGSLWSSTGTLLAQATFTGETASGWQQVTFATPVAITADTVYVASYHAPAGGYSVSIGYFSSTGADNSPLHAPATGLVTGGNGAYIYGASPAFPVNTYNGTNYWVDVVLMTP